MGGGQGGSGEVTEAAVEDSGQVGSLLGHRVPVL